jgi:hypothetical protein
MAECGSVEAFPGEPVPDREFWAARRPFPEARSRLRGGGVAAGQRGHSVKETEQEQRSVVGTLDGRTAARDDGSSGAVR